MKGAAALSTAAFALVVLFAGQRSPAARWLGVFLTLISANFVLEALRVGNVENVLYSRLSGITAALDPLALLAFSASLPGAAPVRRWTWALVAAGAAALALWSGWLHPGGHVRMFTTPLYFYTLLVYVFVLRRTLHAHADAPAWRPLIVGMGVAIIPVAGRMTDDLMPLLRAPTDPLASTLLIGLVASLSIFAAYAIAVHGAPREAHAGRLLLAGLILAFILGAHNLVLIASQFMDIATQPVEVIGRVGAAMRWILFAALASVALVRDDVLGFGLAARRRAARVMLGVAFLTLVVIALDLATLFSPDALGVRPFDVAIIIAIFGVSQGFREVIDAIAQRAYGLPAGSSQPQMQAHYQQATARVLARGGDPSTDPMLVALREEMRLDATTADLLHRLAEEHAPSTLAAGARVAGRYRVDRLLGRALAGRIFLAHDEVLDRDVILKEILHEPDDEALLQAACDAGSVQHPNVVTVYDVLRRVGSAVLVEERVAGGSVEDALARGGLSRAAALRVIEDVLCGLAEAHAHGIVHRALTPGHVLLTLDGGAKVADFGIAALAPAATVDVRAPAYGAPPPGGRATPATDVAAVGALARALLPEPGVYAQVIARAIEDEPAARWRDAGEMLSAWRRAG